MASFAPAGDCFTAAAGFAPAEERLLAVAGFAPAGEGFAGAGLVPLEERLAVVADFTGAAARVAARAGVALAGARKVRFLAGDAADFERPTDLGAFAVPI